MKMKRLLSILLGAALLLSLLPGAVLAEDQNPTYTTGIYMGVTDDGEPSGDVNTTYALSYSSNCPTQFAFYYYDADADNFYARRTTIELVSVSLVGSNLWMVTLNSDVSGNQSLLFNAMKNNGNQNELTMELTDLTPPMPAGIYTVLDENGAPDIDSLVQENQGPGPKYALSYTSGSAKTFYYYNTAVNEILPGMGTSVAEVSDHLWAITMKAGFKGEFTWLFSLDNDSSTLGIYFYDGSGNPGGWIPDYKPVEGSSDSFDTATPEIASAPLGLQKFSYGGNEYYFGFLVDSIVEGGSSGRDGAVYAMLEPNIYTLSGSLYEPVSGDLRTALQTYLGAITLNWYAEEGSAAAEAPKHCTCTEDCLEPSEYYWRFGDKNFGVWYLTATAENLKLTSVAKYRHYKNNETAIAASDATELAKAMYMCANDPDVDNTTYVFTITAPEFYGYVTIPAKLKYVTIKGRSDQGNNSVTWYGGISTGETADDSHRPVVQNINFVSPAGDETVSMLGEGNETVPNAAIYGKRSVNVMFCTFTGFDRAIDLQAPAYMSACTFQENKTGIYVEGISSIRIDACTFEGNHTGLWLKDLPKTAILNNYVIKWNSFKNNTIAVKCNWGNANRPFFMPYNYFNGNQTQSSGKIYTYPESVDEFYRDFKWETGGSVSNEGDYHIPASVLTQNISFDILDSISGEVMGKWSFGGGKGK